eukprot:scaffold5860_cov103-Isochrysis_galbana.AAC.3
MPQSPPQCPTARWRDGARDSESAAAPGALATHPAAPSRPPTRRRPRRARPLLMASCKRKCPEVLFWAWTHPPNNKTWPTAMAIRNRDPPGAPAGIHARRALGALGARAGRVRRRHDHPRQQVQ